MHGKMHAERFLQRSVSNVSLVQCSSQMSVLSTGVYVLETLSLGAKKNPHFYEDLERTPRHVMVWAGVSVTRMFGPFFFHGSVTGRVYHDMLSEWLVAQLQQEGIKDTVVLQLDGTPLHFALHVHDYLNETFPGRWIGRGSEASPTPFAWPPRSPDLATPDIALWGFIKERVNKMPYGTTEVLQAAVEEAFTHVSPDYLPEHGAEFNCATTMKVSIPMF
jgi:hypothetical protein